MGDGYLLGVMSADRVVHLRHKARGSGKILIGDELFDIVYRDGGVDNAAGAGLLTGLVADTAADGREGVLLLYELQSLGIASHGGELYVALNGDMRRADGLAGGGAAVHNVASVGAVVDVVGLAVPGDGDVGVLRGLEGWLVRRQGSQGTEKLSGHEAEEGGGEERGH